MTELALWEQDLKVFERELQYATREYLKHVKLIKRDIARAKKYIKTLTKRK